MLSALFLLTAGGAGLVSAEADVNVRAINPTLSGQIGVNTVSIGDTSQYHMLHGHTKYWDQESSTTKWIGVNTEYLTDLPYVTTVDSKPTVTTAAAHVAVSVVAVATDGAEVGDIAITFSEKMASILDDIAGEVATLPCGRRKRMACQGRAGQFVSRVVTAFKSGGRLSFVSDFPTITITAPEIAQVVAFVTNARIRALVGYALFAYVVVNAGDIATNIGHNVARVFRVSKAMAVAGGAGSDVESCPPFQLGCDSCRGNTLGICVIPWAGCPCKKSQDCPNPQPKCSDEKCKGDDEGFCTVENRGCTCEKDDDENKCPESPEDSPECEECGGNAGDNKCKDEYNGAKDCGCNEFLSVDVYPLQDIADGDQELATSTREDWKPDYEDPANHECNSEGDYWTTKDQLLKWAEHFCGDNHPSGNYLRYRYPGKPADDMTNAVTETYNVEGTDNTVIHFYGFVDESSDDCKNRFPDGIDMVKDDCISAMKYLVDNCPTDDDNKKFGGSANIKCQHYNMTPQKKVNEAPTEPSDVPSDPEPSDTPSDPEPSEVPSIPSSCCVKGVDETCC